MEFVKGGVCAARGYTASGIHCGIRKNKAKRDLALILSEKPAQAACVYTKNLVKGAPLTVTAENVKNGVARAIICNSGNANTCNADGIQVARRMCDIAAKATGVDAEDVIVASTGVIGQPLDVTPVAAAADQLASELSSSGSANAAEAIMTTDTAAKEVAVRFVAGGRECFIGGIAKGSGMIHPDMATMLVFITSDCNISADMLQKALSADIKDSFNMVSVDGDTSTNDMVAMLANGMAGNDLVDSEGEDYDAFCQALAAVTRTLCRMIAADGEGATKLLDCKVTGAADTAIAKTVAKSVICSSLLKAAMFGADANWGRVLCAIGYSGADVDVTRVGVGFESCAGKVQVCSKGAGIDFSEELAKKVLSEKDITILVDLGGGDGCAEAWGCDLTYDYVKINGDYRT